MKWNFIVYFIACTCIASLVHGQLEGTTCRIPFYTRPELSDVKFQADLIRPLSSEFSIVNGSEVSMGLLGVLYAQFPATEEGCPATGSELAQKLRLLQTEPPDRVQLYPSTIQLQAGTLSTVDVKDLEFSMSITMPSLSQSDGAGELETADGVVSGTIAGGYTVAYNFLTPDGGRVDVIGLNSTSGDSEISVAVNGSEVLVTVENFNMTYEALYQSAGISIDGLTIYRFLGKLVLQAVVGCQPDQCGPHGRCSIVEDAETGLQSAVCSCECGWSGAACNVQSGFCTKYAGDEVATCAVMEEDIDAPGPPSLEYSPCYSTQCSAFELFDVDDGGCSCKPGWSGPRCEACTTDSACSEYYGTSSTCSDEMIYTKKTAWKSYMCDTGQMGLDNIIVPGTLFVSCNTTSVSPEQGNIDDGSYCKVNFVMQEYPTNPITCKASFCSFFANSAQVNCEAVSCGCSRDCPALGAIFKSIQGNPCQIDCDEDGTCSFDIKNFYVSLKGPCTNHNCLVEGYSMQEGSLKGTSEDSLDPLLASIPLLVVVGVALGLFAFLLSHRHLYFITSAELIENHEKVDVIEVPSSVRVLKFDNIRASVLVSGTQRNILSGVSGTAEVGELVGLMGSSGSGKTSLLSILAGAAPKNMRKSGFVAIDDVPIKSLQSVAYCAQDSFLLPTLTVEESVRYSAILRSARGTSAESIHSTVSRVIEALGLTDVSSSLVGGSGKIRGVSGGERIRVSVAMELVINPSILLLDEPISGT